MTSRAFDDHVLGWLLFIDFKAVQAGVDPLVTLVIKPCYVPRCMIAPAYSTLTILNARLREPQGDQPARIRLAEVRRRDTLRDTCTLGGVLEVVSPGIIRGGSGVLSFVQR